MVVLLPESLLQEVDRVADRSTAARAFIRDAMRHLLAESADRKTESGGRLPADGPLNLELAEEGLSQDMEEFDRYLDRLVVGEDS